MFHNNVKLKCSPLCGSMVFFAVLSGCSLLEVKGSEDVVRERAQERVDALLNKDLKKAYEYATPALRGIETVEQYHARVAGAALWTRGKVLDVSCAENSCDVKLSIGYKILRFGLAESERVFEEKWLKVDGQWWLYHKI